MKMKKESDRNNRRAVLIATVCLLLSLPLTRGSDDAYEALVPFADACWAHGQQGRGTRAAASSVDAADILLPADRSFVACHPDASMEIRFALTQAGVDAAEKYGETVSVSLDGVVLLKNHIDELGPYIMDGVVGGQARKTGNVVISLALPFWGGDVEFDFSMPFHVVDVAVGDLLSSRAMFRLELSLAGPFGCYRSAAVAAASDDWYLATEEAAYGMDEERIYSQNGEDGVLSAILVELGFSSVLGQVRDKLRGGREAGAAMRQESGLRTPARGSTLLERSVTRTSDGGGSDGGGIISSGLYLEIGAGDGSECNTRLLREAGWQGITLDSGYEIPEINLYKAFVTPDTVHDVVSSAAQRASLNLEDLDVLSIDIDGMDWYIWSSIGRRMRPKIVIIEYNSMLASPADQVQPPNGFNGFDAAALTGSMWFGAGAGAMQALGARLGYTLVYAETRGVNLFLVRDDLVGRLRLSSHLGDVSKTLSLVRWRPCYIPKPYLSHVSWDKATAVGMQWLTSFEALAACPAPPSTM